MTNISHWLFVTSDDVLKRNKVDDQAYHWRSFIENHCIKYLKIKCTRDIGTNIWTLTSKHTDDTSIKRKATLTAERLKYLNEGFRTIYTNLSHCRPLVDSETNQIKRYVKAYMKFYRLHVPNRVFPKLHFLETHCLEWIEKYPFGMGLFSEQGSESLHAHVRILEIRCHGIPNEEKKMKSVMQKYLYQVSQVWLLFL